MEKEKKRHILIIISCVIASFGLWFYISTSVNPIKTITIKNVPVAVTNKDALTQAGLIELPGQQYTVDVKIKGPITEIYQVTRDQIKVEVNMSKYALKKGENTIPVDITNNSSYTSISIPNSEPVFVKVNLDKYMEKSFPVITSMLDIKTLQGYLSMPAVLNPVEAVVSGPAKYVSMVNSVQAAGTIKESSKDSSTTVSLKAVDEAKRVISEVSVKPAYAEALVPVKKIKTVRINVKTTGKLPKNFILNSVVSNPDKIDLAADEKTIDSIDSIDTEPVDLSKIGDTKSAAVNLVIPDGVKNVNNITQVNVTFALDKIVQKNYTINVSYKNLGDSLTAVLDKQSVSIVVEGSEKIVNDNLKSSDFAAAVDLGSLIEGGPYIKNIDITMPQGVTKVPQTPETVSVTITKK